MNKVKKYFVILMISLASMNSVFAQDKQPQQDSSWRKDAWDDFKSPVATDAKYPLLIGTGLTAVLLLFEDQIIDPVQKETVEHKPLGRFSILGDLGGRGYPNALYVAGMLSYGFLESDSISKRNATGMFEASLYSILLTTGLKYTVRETRPDATSKDSFPSGHTAAAFSFASYVGCRHSLGWGIAAYSLAVFTGFSRINDNRHYLHDVTAGAAIGIAYGVGVCLMENKRENSNPSNISIRWQLAPIDDGAVAGLTVRY